MKRMGPLPASPDAYVQSIGGWQRERVNMLRAIAHKVGDSDEIVKWGHLVYLANGPAFLIRAEVHATKGSCHEASTPTRGSRHSATTARSGR